MHTIWENIPEVKEKLLKTEKIILKQLSKSHISIRDTLINLVNPKSKYLRAGFFF